MEDLAEIERQLADLQAKRDEIIKSNRAATLEEVRKTIKVFGFKASELGIPLKPKASKASSNSEGSESKPVTFKDEANGLEWNGELNQSGRKPKWIADRIADGTIENYRVKAA